jgi:hypothetical protein
MGGFIVSFWQSDGALALTFEGDLALTLGGKIDEIFFWLKGIIFC